MSTTRANSNRTNKKVIRAVLVGDTNSGKTQLFNRLTGRAFDQEYKATAVECFRNNELTENTLIQYWDTAGSYWENMKAPFWLPADPEAEQPNNVYLQVANIAICVVDSTTFDFTNGNITDSVRHLLNNIETNIPVMIVFTKADLNNEILSQISIEDFNARLAEECVRLQKQENRIKKIMMVSACTGNTLDLINPAIIEAVHQAENTAKIYLQNSIDSNYLDDIIHIIPYLKNHTSVHNQTLAIELQTFQQELTRLPIKIQRTCKLAVFNAVNAVCISEWLNKNEFLKELHNVRKQLPKTKKFKALFICMMAIGAILAVVGALTTAVSVGAIATGVFAPLGVLGVAGGATMLGLGLGIAGAGMGLFANSHKFHNQGNMKRIEGMLKNK